VSRNRPENDLHASLKIDSPLTRGFGSEQSSLRVWSATLPPGGQ
jgi:hypothetical protein